MNAQSNQQHPTQPSPIQAMRRSWHIAALLLCVASLLSQPVWSQSRAPVRLLSGFPPGGNIDVLARLLAEPMSEALERPVVVENRPGAGGQIAAELLKSAPADGSVLMLCPDAILVIRPYTLATAPYNPVSDFTAIAHTGTWAMAVGVAANVPAKNLAEFASWAKGRAGGGSAASYGSAGEGGSTHLLGALLAQAMGADDRRLFVKVIVLVPAIVNALLVPEITPLNLIGLAPPIVLLSAKLTAPLKVLAVVLLFNNA